MNYIERKVRSAPGLSQEQALESLQTHPNFRPGTKLASLRRRGDRWVAVLQVPKTSAFPPSDDGGGEEGPPKKPAPDEGPDDGPDGPPDEGGGPPDDIGGPPEGGPDEGGEKKPGKGGTEEMVLHVLTEILHALKGGPAGPGMGGPDDMGPGPDAMGGPPPHGGHGLPPAGPPPPGGGMGIGAKLKPGEVPNKPGVVVPGAPAFSSTNPLAQRIGKVAGRQRHIPVSSPVGMSIKQAKTELDPIASHFGYRVAQVKYCGPSCSCNQPGSAKIHALLEAS